MNVLRNVQKELNALASIFGKETMIANYSLTKISRAMVPKKKNVSSKRTSLEINLTSLVNS